MYHDGESTTVLRGTFVSYFIYDYIYHTHVGNGSFRFHIEVFIVKYTIDQLEVNYLKLVSYINKINLLNND